MRNFTKTGLLAAVIGAGMISVVGCTDSKYDFNEIDSTIGIGGDGLTLPGNSTDTISLSEVLDIDGSESVVTRENGDYMFTQDGGYVDPAHPHINKVELNEEDAESIDLPLVGNGAEGDVQTFKYSNDWPEGVIELTGAETSETFDLTIDFSGVRANLSTLKELTLTFPSYMVLENVTGSTVNPTMQGTSAFTFTDLSTADDITVKGDVARMNFKADKTLGQLSHVNNRMELDGKVRMKVAFEGSGSTNYGVMKTQLTIGQFNIVKVTGRFDPDIDLNNLGDVEITGVPDFLDDDEVKLDVYNPQIQLTIKNDMDIDGEIVNGVLRSYDKNGIKLAEVNVPKIDIDRNGSTNVCICRSAAALAEELGANHGYKVTEVEKLSTLIETIPDRITFDADVKANSDNEGSFVLGKTDYTVSTSYKIEAPLAFADNAQIVYSDTLDGWHEDIEDIEFKEGSYLHLTGRVKNCVPAYLSISATPIDVDGNVCSGAVVTIVKGSAVASADGVNEAESDLEIKMEGDIRDLDGLVLKITASAYDKSGSGATVKGITLNEKKHYIIVKDIMISLEGGLVIDMN